MTIGKIYGFFGLILPICVLAMWSANFSGHRSSQQLNQPPAVKLINPKTNTIININTPVSYEINVADKEDGDSKYDEINAKEVLLEERYTKDKSKAAAIINKPLQPDAPGLAVIRTSNCFNCHNFNSKAMGPSFVEVAGKYKPTKANTDSLVKRISAGSTGIWGKEKMPSHPELSAAEIKSAVEWIMNKGAATGDDYLIGLKGIIPAASLKSAGAYVLIASYMDHGLKTTPGTQRLKGQDAVILYAK